MNLWPPPPSPPALPHWVPGDPQASLPPLPRPWPRCSRWGPSWCSRAPSWRCSTGPTAQGSAKSHTWFADPPHTPCPSPSTWPPVCRIQSRPIPQCIAVGQAGRHGGHMWVGSFPSFDLPLRTVLGLMPGPGVERGRQLDSRQQHSPKPVFSRSRPVLVKLIPLLAISNFHFFELPINLH